MRSSALLIALVVGAFVFHATAIHDPDRLVPNNKYVSDEYIVVVKTGSDMNGLLAEVQQTNDVLLQLMHVYRIGSFQGFALRCGASTLQALGEHPDVDFVEQNTVVHAAAECAIQKNVETWGIRRTNLRQLTQLSDDFHHEKNNGAGVDAYIIDTGILDTHKDFGGRAKQVENFSGDGQNTDCNGHGTHVAGTVGGTAFGIAKNVNLIGVKVLSCSGSGTNAGVMAGIDWTVQKCKANSRSGAKCVANMSLGGPKSTAENKAIAAARTEGVIFVVAAGNENQNACNVSPASADGAVTVAATELGMVGNQNSDARAYYSNFGNCVNILAPGSAITSAWIGSDTATNTISGTSMASPHVAGVVASIMSDNPTASAEDVIDFLTGDATDDVVDLACSSSTCRNTVNKMLHLSC